MRKKNRRRVSPSGPECPLCTYGGESMRGTGRGREIARSADVWPRGRVSNPIGGGRMVAREPEKNRDSVSRSKTLGGPFTLGVTMRRAEKRSQRSICVTFFAMRPLVRQISGPSG